MYVCMYSDYCLIYAFGTDKSAIHKFIILPNKFYTNLLKSIVDFKETKKMMC